MNEVLERLYEELAAHPLHYLECVPEPADRLVYIFTMRAEGDPPRDHLFEFSVRYHSDEETLIIWDCEHLALESGSG